MNALRRSLAMLFVVCATGCSDDDTTTSTGTDTGTTVTDTGSTPQDTSTAPKDTGTAPMDTAVTDTGTPPMDTAAPTKHTVDVGSGGNTFAPASLEIKVGDTVEWVWKGDFHTVTEATDTGCTAKSGGFDSGLKSTGATFSRTFSAAGTVNYFCTPHCTLGMKGTITVR